MVQTTKRPTSLTIDSRLIAEAKQFNVNMSQAAEAGLRSAVKQAREEAWKQENAAALESANAYVEEHGLPLSRHRLF